MALLRRADRYRPREFGQTHSRTAFLTKRSAVRSTNHLVTKVCMMRGEMWPRRQERVSPPDASPPRCAQLMGLASRGCLVIVLGATAERRNLFFRSDLGLPWIRSLSLRLSRLSNRSWAERSTGISPTITNSCARNRHRRADRVSGPFHVEGDPGHQGPHRRRLGAAPTPLVLAQVKC